MVRSALARVMLVGAAYTVVGVVLATIANPAPSPARFAWRLTAWLISAALYAWHIVYEQYRLGGSPRTTAVRAAAAAAVGGLGIALAASLHSRHPLVLALVLWPLVTGLPAFLVALVLGALIARFRPPAK